MAKVAIIKTSGEIIVSENESNFVDYETLSNGVGGWIENVQLKDFDLWCNENGLAERLPINPVATKLWQETYPTSRNVILGDVVITGGASEDGGTLGLSEEQVKLILS